MKYNFFGVTFWFNIYENHTEILNVFKERLSDEYQEFNLRTLDKNLINPVLIAVNNELRTNIRMSQINFQYTMDKVEKKDLERFKERVLELFSILKEQNVDILHTSVCLNAEFVDDDAIDKLTNLLNPKYTNDYLVDASFKVGKKEEDLFYKIISLTNKKQIKLPRVVDEQNRAVPIPLISWNGSLIENELVDITYEINDKYSFDFSLDYHTTEFYLNKMLYLLMNDFKTDINNLFEDIDI